MIGYLTILASVLITSALYVQAKLSTPATGWQILAQFSGLLGMLTLCWSYILAIRHRWLENLFGGLDKVYAVHHILGGLTLISLLHHPLFLILKMLPLNTMKTYLLPGTVLSYNLGIFSLYLLLLLIVLTLYVDLPYWLWKQTHEWMGLVLLLGALHSLLVPSDISANVMLRWWMLSWIGAAIMSFFYKRFIYYLLLPKKNYRLEKVSRDGDILIVSLTAVSSIRSIYFEPGQYAFLTIPGKRNRDEHPFTVLKSDADQLVFGIKVIGEFSLTLSHIALGSLVTVRGPYGTFGKAANRAKDMVWISGGIGITPFASMVSTIKPDQQVTMYHTSKDNGPSLITSYFKTWSEEHSNFTWIPHTTQSSARLNAQMIHTHRPITDKTYFFLCGPLSMTLALSEQLANLGVRRKKIIFENFGFK